MKTVEILDWILDKDGESISNDEKYRLNIEFVHSLGLKCDCVGWSTLDLHNPRADEILSAIDSFCKKNGWRARGIYTRSYTDFSSDWYELIPVTLKENTICECLEVESEDGGECDVLTVRAYHELRPSPKWWGRWVLVPERFRDSCIRNGITDVDFCWARDKGKYKSEQYFHIFGNLRIPQVAVDGRIGIEDKERIDALGGYLPRIAEVFGTLQIVNLQDCYLESQVPECDIAYAYFPRRTTPTFLIHKRLAEKLLKEKAVSPSDLCPVVTVSDVPSGYILDKTFFVERPKREYCERSIIEYEKLKESDRPARLVSEKDALKLLRAAKKERKSDFGKALPKNAVADIGDAYAPILPYYLVSNGGYLSDEYEFLSYDKATAENALFFEELCSEELIEEKPNGAVFAKCPDGDRILLCADGAVIRFSHEAPAVTEEWNSLAQFVADAINE